MPLIGMRRTFLQGNFSNYGGMLIRKGKPETSIDMNIIGTAVTPYQEIKYLGRNIDRSLSFTCYISEICKDQPTSQSCYETMKAYTNKC